MSLLPKIHKDVVLAPYTTYKIGGPAKYFVNADSTTELRESIAWANQNNLHYFLLGTGANILVGDKGFDGLVIHNTANSYTFNGNLLRADSGAVLGDLIEQCALKGLSGLEHFAGIPSSVGGAMWQNVHFLAPNRVDTVYIADVVESATILNEKNDTRQVDAQFFAFGYDDSILHHKNIVVLDVTFALVSKSPKNIRGLIAQNLTWREQKQPQLRDFASCGSVFKKIEGVGAGRLIEQVGLKGKKVGGAMVSPQHANYIVNTGDATASDVRKLIALVQAKVSVETGHLLEPEIGFVGEF